MPTCQQLNKKNLTSKNNITEETEPSSKKKQAALTTSQTGETRLVTKVRFIIEKQNSLLKNMKSLENVRNTQVGHILIDYRICCAMLNFNLKPCIPDGKDTVQIAKRIKKRSSKTKNKLAQLLQMKFTSTVNSIEIKSINDFPQFTLSQIRRHITLGGFKIRQSQSYIEDIIKYGKAYVLEKKHIEHHVTLPKLKENLINSKIIAVLIQSRHSRGKKCKPSSSIKSIYDPKNNVKYYKCFIQYNSCEETLEKPYRLIKSKLKICFISQLLINSCTLRVCL
jgi:hypothetical protein